MACWQRASFALACGLLVTALPLRAAAEAPNPHLDEAKQLYREVRYVEVVHKLEMALAVPGNSVEQLTEIYALLGTVHVVLGNSAAARDAFRQLLTIDPDFRFDATTSPKIVTFFDEVKNNFVPPPRAPVAGPARSQSAPVAASADDASAAPAWYAQWWVWAAAGGAVVVAVAATATAVALASSSSNTDPQPTLGSYQLK